MLSAKLFVAQRVTALLLAPLVAGHLAVIVYAVHGGLDAAEILGRTRGNVWFGAFYEAFVCAAAIHAAIGARVICAEWSGGKLRGRALDFFTWTVAAALFGMGSFAVAALVFL